MPELTVDHIIESIKFANQKESGLTPGYAKELLNELDMAENAPDFDEEKAKEVREYLVNVIEYHKKLNKIKNFGKQLPIGSGITAEYFHPYGKPYNHCIHINVEHFGVEMTFFDGSLGEKRYINTCLYYLTGDRSRPFVIGKGKCSDMFPSFQRIHKGSHSMEVKPDEWMDRMLGVAESIVSHKDEFVRMCQDSCPFKEDGTHKYDNWKTTAKLEISSVSENALLQGFKNGSTPSGCKFTGSNGSFVAFSQRYVLRIKLKCLSGEKPISDYVRDIDADEYLRALRDKLGKRQLPYGVLNSKLPQDVEVITTDMEEEPEDRVFNPCGYGGSWEILLNEAFKEL